MDRMLYIAMNGAKQNMLAQSANNNNLANVSTPGFRADFASFRSMPVFNNGYPTRVFAMAERPGVDLSPGSLTTTGNPLDIAIEGEGYIAVQATDGSEAYTRTGNLRRTATGVLLSLSGEPVLGNNGPISVSPANDVEISSEGTVSIKSLDPNDGELLVIDRIKLVNPPAGTLYKGNDGLLRLKDGGQSPANAAVRVVSGTFESSNVNVTEALVNMIDLARQFELHVKMMHAADQQAEKASSLMRLS